MVWQMFRHQLEQSDKEPFTRLPYNTGADWDSLTEHVFQRRDDYQKRITALLEAMGKPPEMSELRLGWLSSMLANK
jgi:hypothetical protein